MNSLQVLDYWAIAIYMLLMAGIGLFLGKFIKNVGDYFKGGNAIPWVSGAISNFMTKFSTFIFVAYAGIAYQHGFVALTLIWCTVLPFLVGVAVFAKRWRRAGIMTPMEFLEIRFNGSVRQLFSWMGVLFKILDNMVRLYALGLFVKAATGLSLESAILVCGIIVAMYTIAGGLWAVVVTDVIQFVILMVATLILVPLTIQAAGGLPRMMATIPEQFTWFNGPKGMPLYLTAYYIMILVKYSGNWTFIQRFYSVRDERASQKQGLLTAIFFFLFPIIFLFPSIAAKAILPNLENPEMAYVSVSLKLLPEGIMGLMIAAMFAATMSVLSGEYNVTAGVMTKDIFQRLFNPRATDRETLWIGRLMTLVLGAFTTIGALFVGGVGGAFEANKLFTGLFAIPLALPLVLGIVLKRPQPWGAFATVVIGVMIGLILNALPQISWEVATLIEIGTCAAIFLVSGLPGRRTVKSTQLAYRQRVDQFFRRLSTPLTEAEKPIEDPAFTGTMNRIYAVALSVTGSLFLSMSVPSLSKTSGQSAFGAGVVCLLLAVLFWLRSRDKKNGVAAEAASIPEAVAGKEGQTIL